MNRLIDLSGNPIPFNTELLTIQQMKRCADILSQAFSALDRDVPFDNICFHLDQARQQMLRDWEAK